MQKINKEELAKNLGLMLVSTLICILLFEAGCRVLDLQPLPLLADSLYMNDDTLGYKFAPNSKGTFRSEDGITVEVTTNSLGMWEPLEPPYTDPVILVLGDSFTHGSYCCELNDTYPKALQKALAGKGRQYTVINSGVPGYGPKNELEMLKKYYEVIKPNIVVMTFYIENDLTDMENPYQYKVVDGRIIDNNYEAETSTPLKRLVYEGNLFLFRESASYRVVKNFIITKFFPKRRTVYKTLFYYRREAKEEQSKNVIAAEDEFTAYNKFCKEHNMTCVIYMVPSKTQFLKDAPKLAQNYGLESELDLFWVQDSFTGFFSANNMTYYDLTGEFKNQSDPAGLYLPRNIHWTEEGCRIAGEYLADRMIKDGLL